jgi:hypothetical protein
MIKSVAKYLGNFRRLSSDKAGRKLLKNEINKVSNLKDHLNKVDEIMLLKALRELASWFKHNQSVMEVKGFGTFYFESGWTSSYPETTGYIVPTLLKYSQFDDKPEFESIAKDALDWLVSIQKPSGGWQSGYVSHNRDEIVFNTGQVLRGLTAGYTHFKEKKYLDSAIKACEWLVSIQNENGSFDKHVYLDRVRVYDSYVVAPMLEVYNLSKIESFKTCAVKNIEWIIREKQLDNGWFQDCDNTIHKNDKPILHTISYAIDGILDCGIYLNNSDFIEAATIPANVLLNKFHKEGGLSGRFDKDWNGSEQLITTGCAQISIIWEKLFTLTGNEKYQQGFQNMNKLLVAIHQRDTPETEDTRGAIFGSFPLWGRYESFGCPNWASKYMMDSLLFQLKQSK